MIRLYIDPGTGSMLFAVLIGVLSAALFAFREIAVKIRFRLSGGRQTAAVSDSLPLVIFADDKRYWRVFEPVCRELDARGFDTVYMTASPDDPGLDNSFEHIRAEFIGEGNKAFAKLNMLKADIVLSTTPGLDVFQWKRSKNVKYYIHIPHAPRELTSYNMFGTDYYDAILMSGECQGEDIRELEKLRSLPAKELTLVGIPYFDDMAERLKNAEPSAHEGVRVMLAPSWGSSSLLNRFGEQMIDSLIATGYEIIIRPHPQSFTSEKELIDGLMQKYPDSEGLKWNTDNDSFDILLNTDILISDFSGIIYDFALVFDKPVIYTDTEFDFGPYDAWWLDRPFWTFTAMQLVGQKLTKDNFTDIRTMIDECLSDTKYTEGREELRRQIWAYRGEGAKRTAEYLINKHAEINRETGEE